jgi:uncharacterized membrane-anchored protein
MVVIPLIIIYVVIFYFINNELSYIRRFKRMKLFNGGVSRTLQDISIKNSRQFKQMVSKGIFIQTKENRYYMEEEPGVEYARKRRGIIYTVSFFFIILVFFIQNNF